MTKWQSVPEPSAVERLAALTDPEIADRVLRYDDPEAWCSKTVERWSDLTCGIHDEFGRVATSLLLEAEVEHMRGLT